MQTDQGFNEMASQLFPDMPQDVLPEVDAMPIDWALPEEGMDDVIPNPIVDALMAIEPNILDSSPEQKLEALRYLIK